MGDGIYAAVAGARAEADRIESNDLAEVHADKVKELAAAWDRWAAANYVTPLPRDLRVPYLKPD